MSEHKRKITVRVTAQTAYHLKELAEAENKTPGQIIDRMMRKEVRKNAEQMRNSGQADR